MSFLLQQLESHFEDELLLKGEQLLENEQVYSLKEAEKHLWVAEVNDERSYEVEIKISPSKVKAITCECDRFKTFKSCEHVVAVLLAVRRKRADIRIEKEQTRKKSRNSTKLTTNSILQEIDPEELLRFVKQYAKGNRNFALALKARFAAAVPSQDSKEKFTQILDSVISMSRKADGQLSKRGAQKLATMLEELQLQIAESFSKEHFSEVIGISQSIIERVTPLLKKAEDNEELLQVHIIKGFAAIQKVLDQHAAPALKQRLWEYGLEESKKLVYRSNGIDQHFYRMLLYLEEDMDGVDTLLQLIDTQIEKYRKEHRVLMPMLLTRVHLLEKEGRMEELAAYVEENKDQPGILLFAIKSHFEKGDYDKAKTLADQGLQKRLPLEQQERMEEFLFKIAEEEKDKKKIIEYGSKLFLRTLDFDFFRSVKAVAGRSWAKILREMRKEINMLPHSPVKLNTQAQLLVEEDLKEELLQLLQKNRSVDLLCQFDEHLYPEYAEALATTYVNILTAYLETHLGRKPSRKIRECIFHLNQIGNTKLANTLVEQFRSTFPERHTLMEELAYF